MSSPIWTPDALRSEVRRLDGSAWRLVEAQHRVSTLKVVDDLNEQEVLENILETTKPPLPDDCRHLDYLLSTPFRYRPYPKGSRFRLPGITAGVWYGAEHPETAAAEMVFYRFLFFAESPKTPFPDDAAEYTAIEADLATAAAIDLTVGALAGDAAYWTHPTDYAPCQSLAETAREAGVEIIRYTSVRDPTHRANCAVLACRAFRNSTPIGRQTWRIRISRSGAQAICEYPRLGLAFFPETFAADPRLADMEWTRPRRD
jgi:hypothetical protein